MDRRKFLALMSSSAAAATQATAAPLRSLRGSNEAAFITPRVSTRPLNVVLMICDDLGYGDLGSFGSKLPTPNLDRMAREGMRFTRYNGGHPLCSASRAALLTGRYGTRMGVVGAFGPQAKTGCALDETLLSQLFKAKGYRTAAIGKWHLGGELPYLPTNRGFDSYFGLNWSVDMSPKPLMRNTTVIEENTDCSMLIPRYTKEAISFLEEDSTRPFFLYYGFPYPHDPPDASPRFLNKSDFGKQGDAIAEIDWSVGEIVKTLEAKHLASDTLILFTSDHGPWFQGSPGNLRGRKASTWEGGFRVPLLAKLSGVVPAGAVCDTPASHLDILPTLSALCNLSLPAKPLDGADASALLLGRGKPVAERTQIYFSPMSKGGLQPHCIRKGDWKLRVAQAYDGEIYVNVNEPGAAHKTAMLARPELYNVALDPSESYCVADIHPDIVAGLGHDLDTQLATFPQNVQDAYALLKQTAGRSNAPVGGPPRMPEKP
jgi:arylsulfatase A